MNNIREIVISTFESNIGISLENYENIALKDLDLDSFEFINFVVELESKLAINLPEEYLLLNELPDIVTFSQIIQNLYEMRENVNNS